MRSILRTAALFMIPIGILSSFFGRLWEPWIFSALVLSFLAMAEAMGERP